MASLPLRDGTQQAIVDVGNHAIEGGFDLCLFVFIRG